MPITARVCPYCSQEVEPQDDGRCPSCQQSIFPPRDPGPVASNPLPLGGSSEDPLGFLASEQDDLRAAKWGDKQGKKEARTALAHLALLSPRRALVAFLLKSRVGSAIAIVVALAGLTILILGWSGVLGE